MLNTTLDRFHRNDPTFWVEDDVQDPEEVDSWNALVTDFDARTA